MKQKVVQSLGLLALIALTSSLALAEGGTSPSVSSDVNGGKSINIDLDTHLSRGEILIKPYVLNGQVGGFESLSGDGIVGTVRIDASARYPITLNGRHVYDGYGRGWDVELSPGITLRVDERKLDGETVKALRADVAVTGATLLRGWACGDGTGFQRCEAGDTVSGTADVAIVQIGGRYSLRPVLEFEQYGLDLQAVRGSVHGAFKFAGVQIDFCAEAAAGAVVLGKTKIGERETASAFYAALSACAGLDLGRVGELKDQVSAFYQNQAVNLDAPGALDFTNTVTLKHIGYRKSPFGLFWTYEELKSLDRGALNSTHKQYKAHFVGLDLSF